MGDIAQILGVGAKPTLSLGETAQAILAGPTPINQDKKKKKKEDELLAEKKKE